MAVPLRCFPPAFPCGFLLAAWAAIFVLPLWAAFVGLRVLAAPPLAAEELPAEPVALLGPPLELARRLAAPVVAVRSTGVLGSDISAVVHTL